MTKQLLSMFSPLLAIAIVCTLLVAIVNGLTGERIQKNRRHAQLKLITEVMPLPHDNDLLEDKIEVTDPAFLGTDAPVSIYIARQQEKPVGLVFMPVIATGYVGLIELAVGISAQGELTGVRVGKHEETEGLGDRIHQKQTDWVLGFDNRSLENTPIEAWAVKNDGGDFDQLSGATISPRGVVKAVKRTLEYYEIYKEDLLR